jgi:hypothetical protein
LATTTTRLALSKPASSDPVDIAVLNANSDKIDNAVGAKRVTSSSRPSTPFDGQVIFETDTNKYKIYDATAVTWKDNVSTTAETATNALKVGNHQIFVQSTEPTSGMVAGDLLFWGS